MRLFELKAKSLPISHHVNNKNCKFPFWVVVPELTFGETTKIIELLNDKYYTFWLEELFFSNDYYKNEANLKEHIISASKSWIAATWFIRNVCAHYGRLYARNFNVGVPRLYTPVLRKMKDYGKKKTDNKDLFAYMLAIKQILICHNSSVHDEWNRFIEEIENKIMTSSIVEKTKIGFPECWKDWLEELKQVFEDHINYVVDLFGKETNIKVMKPQGTYLIWLDFSAYDLTDERLQELLRNEAKVILNRGLDFGEEGSLHARLNVAMPKSLLQEVCQRIVTTFAKL